MLIATESASGIPVSISSGMPNRPAAKPTAPCTMLLAKRMRLTRAYCVRGMYRKEFKVQSSVFKVDLHQLNFELRTSNFELVELTRPKIIPHAKNPNRADRRRAFRDGFGGADARRRPARRWL